MLVALGAWGAIVPFIGPSFNLTIGPDATFHWTTGRFWLSLLPGVVAAVGGLMVLLSANRATASLGAQLAIAAGAWFCVGPTVSQLWSHAPGALGQAGFAAGDEGRRVLEVLAYFYAVGAAITTFAALALGRMTLRTARDAELAAAVGAPAVDAAAGSDATAVLEPGAHGHERLRSHERGRDRPVLRPTAAHLPLGVVAPAVRLTARREAARVRRVTGGDDAEGQPAAHGHGLVATR
jgi:hypothetical protein